jgi:hypothetical protein
MIYNNQIVTCKIWGFHGGDYVENRLLGCSSYNPEDDFLQIVTCFDDRSVIIGSKHER